MLVLLSLLYYVAARDIPLQSTYVTKYIEKCPEEGYFFKRDLQGTTAGACYLCFCKENGTAVCWQRNNKKCDAESYQHNWVKKRASRNRRSPVSFSDVFFGDATRDVLNQNGKKSCKPNEASYSEGCPPVDWCVGCTVCDCNVNGKWDCHLLSFCTEEDKKNRKKGEKGELKGHFYDPFAVPKTRKVDRVAAQQQVQNLAEKMAQDRQKKKIGPSNRRRYFFKNGTLVNKTIFDMRKRKKSPTILNQSSAEVQKWSNLNMKIRKIPDQITRQRILDKQQENAKKVSESANFYVRKMPNKKTKQIIEQKHAQAVNVLAKRQPNRKKKRQVILPSGIKLPKELLDKLPPGVIPPTRNPPGDHYPKKSHIKRVLPNQMAATKPARQDKKLVKRSAKYDTSNNKYKRKEIPHRNKNVPTKAQNKKKRNTKENNKMPMRINLKKNIDNKKNNYLKINNMKINKDKGKNKEKNDKNNIKPKIGNNVKNNPNKNKSMKKSLKNSDHKKNNNQKIKATKSVNGNIKNVPSKRSIDQKISVNKKNKQGKDYKDKKNATGKDKHDLKKKPVIKSPHNNKTYNHKPIRKPVHEKTNKNDHKKEKGTRGKRSSETWVKTIKEGKRVTKYAPKFVSSDMKAEKNVKKAPKKAPPKTGTPQLNRRKLNEEVKRITGNIQANLNRKVLDAVQQMLGQKIVKNSKKVKRSAPREAELIHENLTDEVVNESGIEFSENLNPDHLNRLSGKQMFTWKDLAEEKEGLSLPLVDFSAQKVKRSVNEDETYNESRHIPFIVKKRPLPPVKHIEKREVDVNEILKDLPITLPTTNHSRRILEKIEYPTLTTEDYSTTDMTRSVPLSKPDEKDNSDLIDIHVPIKKISRNIVIPETEAFVRSETPEIARSNNIHISKAAQDLSTTKDLSKRVKRSAPLIKKITVQKNKRNGRPVRSNVIPIKKEQKIPVEKTNKVKVNRHKRNAIVKESETTNLQVFGNDISTNSLQDAPNMTIQNYFATTDSIFKYYKYTIDDYLDNTKQADKKYLSEVVEVYTKNSAAKRSIDEHMKRSSDIDVLQITHNDSNNEIVPVRGLKHDGDETTQVINSYITENLTVMNDDERLKVHAAELHNLIPINVLDDKVVIIQDQNISSINTLSELITDHLPSTTVPNDLELSLINKTVIGIKSPENQSAENIVTSREDIGKSNTMVDKSVVIISDQNDAPTTKPQLGLTTEYRPELSSDINIIVEKEASLVSTTGKSDWSSQREKNSTLIQETLQQPTTSTSIRLTDYLTVGGIDNNFTKTKAPYNEKGDRDDKILIVREKNSNQFENNSDKYLFKQTTENYIKSQYKVDNNFTKQSISLKESLNKSELITAKTISEQIKNKVSSLKSLNKNYLKYDVDAKSYDSQHDSQLNVSKPRKYKKQKEIMIQEDVIANLNENTYVPIVVHEEKHTKIEENSAKNNDTILTGKDLKAITNTVLTVGEYNIVKEGDWAAATTLKMLEENYTTQVLDDIYTTEKYSYNHQLKKNQSNRIAQNIVKTHDIKKIDFKNARKHKLKKILSTLFNKTEKNERYFNKQNKYFNKEDTYSFSSKEQKSLVKDSIKVQKSNKTNDLKAFFKKLLSGFKFNKHMRKPSNMKRFKILKYLQKFFKKIFSDDGKHKNNKTIAHLNRRNIIETLCSSFGPCNINIKNKAKLQSQIDHLNSETYKMLRSVKIIKGLLKLVDMAKNDKKLNNGTSLKTNFKNDVQKLHAILRDTYSHAEQMDKLTETQKIQIQYIKNSTQNFIQSAAKFTMVLNEIINIITIPQHKRIKDDHHSSSVERKNKTDIKKIFKSQNTNKTVAVAETSEALKKLKELISKYSLIQNTFMRKIYNVLTNLDRRESVKKRSRVVSPTAPTNVNNKTEEIQMYTKNIIQNLRKLKNLAQNLNGDGEHVRRKRDLRNDDSLEYMLMLMEYLLKKQQPLDSAPVNDGIDLLIEAIKNAPDIKAIKKKVLPTYSHSTPITFRRKEGRNQTSHNSGSSEVKRSKETSSDSDSKPSKEENVTSIILEEPKLNAIDQSIDDEGEEQDYYLFNRRAQSSTVLEITTSTESHTNKEWHEQVSTDPYYNTIPDVEEVTKPKIKVKSEEEKVTSFDIFNRYTDEESTTAITTELDYTTTVSTEIPVKTEMTTKSIANTPSLQIPRYNKADDDISASKSRIDWLDETYEEEIKVETTKANPTTAKPSSRVRLNKIKEIESLNVTNENKITDISGLSKEIAIEDEVSKKPTTAKEKEILYKKEIGLLNSLDYGTERTEMDVSSSRESGAIDKYTGDAFSTYFREEKI